MLELAFWMVVSILSSIGIVQIVSYLEQLCCKSTLPVPVVLILENGDTNDLELKIRRLFFNMNFKCNVAVVDIGINEDKKETSKQITQRLGVEFIDKNEIVKYLEKKDGEKDAQTDNWRKRKR